MLRLLQRRPIRTQATLTMPTVLVAVRVSLRLVAMAIGQASISIMIIPVLQTQAPSVTVLGLLGIGVTIR